MLKLIINHSMIYVGCLFIVSHYLGFPLDLPISTVEADPESNVIIRDCSHSGASEPNVPKSLPDFLNDGPIHNRTTLSTESGSIPNSVETTERRV